MCMNRRFAYTTIKKTNNNNSDFIAVRISRSLWRCGPRSVRRKRNGEWEISLSARFQFRDFRRPRRKQMLGHRAGKRVSRGATGRYSRAPSPSVTRTAPREADPKDTAFGPKKGGTRAQKRLATRVSVRVPVGRDRSPSRRPLRRRNRPPTDRSGFCARALWTAVVRLRSRGLDEISGPPAADYRSRARPSGRKRRLRKTRSSACAFDATVERSVRYFAT